jgi:hypothetical protein
MSVETDLAELRRLAKTTPALDAGDFAAMESLAEILGYLATCARQEGCPEADAIEVFVRAADFTNHEIRAAERKLRKVGFRLVADRLRELAPRTKRQKPTPGLPQFRQVRN